MRCDILTEINDNKISFTLSMPFEFFDIDEDKYHLYDNTLIYECNYNNINFNDLNSNFNTIIKELQKEYPIISSNYEYIRLNDKYISNKKSLYNFLKQNKNLNILLITNYTKDLVQNLKDENYPNLKIAFSNSTENISYKEFYQMNLKLNEIIDFVNYYNLSPLEKIILVYDIVKSRKYNKESENENKNISRNLDQIINNDKIVCVGYSNLIDYLLTNLGINSNIIDVDYTDKNVGHERNYIYLKDDKYDIDGIFFLDATWDSKRNKDYIDNYYFFLKPLSFFKTFRKNEIIRTPIAFRLLQNSKKEILEKIKNSNEIEIIDISSSFQTLTKKYKNKEVPFLFLSTKSDEEINNIIEEIYSKYNKQISEENFKNALYKVRKIEYINNIIDFIPTQEYIDSVYKKCYPDTAELRLLKLLGLYDTSTFDKSLEDSKSTSIEEDLLKIRFLHAIKTKIQDFPENEFIKKM